MTMWEASVGDVTHVCVRFHLCARVVGMLSLISDQTRAMILGS